MVLTEAWGVLDNGIVSSILFELESSKISWHTIYGSVDHTEIKYQFLDGNIFATTIIVEV